MAAYRVQEAASHCIDGIYCYSRDTWGSDGTENYITGLFEAFAEIANQNALSHPIPASFGVDGYFVRYKKHFIYWKTLKNSDFGIVTILHERMHQIDRFREDFRL
jgi:toxin ParE1/3/4